VHVEVAVEGTELMIIIEDNGSGIDTERREAVGSHGLATMRHRVRSFGGTLDIESPPHGGTRVRARIPLAVIVQDQGARPIQPAANDY
jgi:two-component system sensor histidine kinase DesK